MTTSDLACRFRHPVPFTGEIQPRCLHHQVFLRDRAVTQDLCAVCEKKQPFELQPTKPVSWSALDAEEGSGFKDQRNCLIVLQPRNIARCLKTIDDLPIDKVYFRAFSEPQLVVPINDYIRTTNYDNYLIVADDVIVSRWALDIVVDLLRRHELVTGYCRISQDSPYANVTRGPLRLKTGRGPIMSDYDFYHMDEIVQFQDSIFLSWFGGWAFTGIRRDIWLEFPFRVNRHTGAQSDFESSYFLNRPFVCHRAAYIEHIKPHLIGFCQENFLVGVEPPRIIFKEYKHA